MSVYRHTRQLVVKEFFQTRSDFPGIWQKLVFFCFHCVTKTHRDKIAAKMRFSVWQSGWALRSQFCSIIILPLHCMFESRWCSIHPSLFFLWFWIIVLSPSFSLLIYYISLYHIILLPLLTDLGFAWKILSFLNYFCFVFTKLSKDIRRISK